MTNQEIILFLARHGIKHQVKNNQVFAEDYHIRSGIKKRYWFPVTGSTENELQAAFILSD
jgi:hypothetical protein